MKPFKFRVWNKNDRVFDNPNKLFLSNGTKFIGFSLNQNGDLLIIGTQFGKTIIDIETIDFIEKCESPYEISYSTGLFDKNGKEIFEGDILNCDPTDWFGEEKPEGHNRLVIWSEPCFSLLSPVEYSDYGAAYLLNIISKRWDVIIIGNKYENPEILDNLK